MDFLKKLLDYLTPKGRRARKLMARATPVMADAPDERDYVWVDKPDMVLPTRFDLSHLLLSIENQGQIGECVGEAGTTIFECIRRAFHQLNVELSDYHLYWHARFYSGTQDRDIGTTLRNALKAMYRVGVALKSAWPSVPSMVNVTPPADVDLSAYANRISRYERIKEFGSVDDIIPYIRRIKEALATGHPVYLAMGLERDFYYLGNTETHNYRGLSKFGAVMIGGHAMTIVGWFYDGVDGYFIIANSWGTSWGRNGFAILPMVTVVKDSFDIWVITEVDGVNVAQARQNRMDVARLYVALFGRAPDVEGLYYWTKRLNSGETVVQLAVEMFGTTPARTFYPEGLSKREVVRSFYVNVLGRQPDAGGLDYWTARMESEGVGEVIAAMIAVVVDYKGTDTDGIASADLFAARTTKALVWGESGGGVVGSREAII